MRSYGHIEDGKVGSLSDYHLWGRIFQISSGYKVPLGAAVGLSLIVTAATLALPYLLQQGIDQWIIAEGLPAEEKIAGLAKTSLYYLGIVGVAFITTFIQVLILEWIGQSVMHTIRQKLFLHICSLDLAFLNSQPTGRLVTRLTNDIQNMHEMFTSVIVTLFNDLLRIFGILLLLYWMNVSLAMVMSIFIPLAALITYFFSKLARDRFSAIRSQLAKMNGFLQEAVSGMSIIQLFGRQQSSKSAFMELSIEYLERCLRQIRLFGTFMPMTEMLGSIAIALILWYGGSEVLSERLTLGELVAFIAYMRLFFQPLRELSQKYSIVQSAMASAERIFQLLDRKGKIVETSAPIAERKVKGDLDFEELFFSYKEGEQVLKGINLSVGAGSTVAIVGTTGSGKSTLINLLMRFYVPDSGMIRLDGEDIGGYGSDRLRSIVGVVLQDVYILQDSLLANIVMDTGKTRDQVLDVLGKAGMMRLVERLPEGLETQIGEGGHELSTGEKQLLSFARVLCRDPQVLVLDEATAAVDTESEDILEQSVEEIFSGRTSLIIAHRISTIRRADYIAVMHLGEIVEYGSHEELMEKGGFYRNLVDMDKIGSTQLNQQESGQLHLAG